ncbi:aldo/keto reductase [Pseudonocardia sp. KRD291]|uniref:aldo/keto reductase n=1 Tax=Pseudonocardia sp. KRD291 TaxID=2792007 RepID=UPI001CF771D3|nr:aldo/keto reductase [Pseudonocardia sp. KRD291]
MSSAVMSDDVVQLNNGVAMPRLGFGVSEVHDTEAAVGAALRAGYRSIDTAEVYGNEDGVGAAIAASGIPREDLFVTTKVWNDDRGRDRALRAAERSLDRLGLDHVDLYLVHWPTRTRERCEQTWDAMETLLADGRTRAIGVSNFRLSHLERVLGLGGTVPAVNQIELHPGLEQRELRAAHAAHGIVTEAWSPLGRGTLLDEPVITRIASRLGRSPAQVVLRWHLQQGTVVIPKSNTPQRIAENRAVHDFALTDRDMLAVSTLDDADGSGRIGPVPDDLALAQR